MNRRTFLKSVALAGVSLLSPLSLGRGHSSEPFDAFEGPFWLIINNKGGWDPTMLCDPRGHQVEVKAGKSVNPDYSRDEIIEFSDGPLGVRLAPYDFDAGFLDSYRDRLVFINGVDAETNGHVPGQRVSFSGTLDRGYPSLAALIAMETFYGGYERLPMPFITFGGYDHTADEIVPVRLNNMKVFSKIADPNIAKVRSDGLYDKFYDDRTLEHIEQAASDRLEAGRGRPALPSKQKAYSTLFGARLNQKNIGRIMDEVDLHLLDSGGSESALIRQGHLALASFSAGISVSTNLLLPRWDSHSNNLRDQSQNYDYLFRGLRHILAEAEARGLDDKLHIVVASDFGRTPFLNSADGKDHWSVGSWMYIRPRGDEPGPRAVGATDEQMRAMHVDTALGVHPHGSSSGVKLTPAHIHQQLRRRAGIADGPFATRYGLGVEDIPLFA